MTNLSLCPSDIIQSGKVSLGSTWSFSRGPHFSTLRRSPFAYKSSNLRFAAVPALMSGHHRANMNSLPDEILLRVFVLIEPAKSSWLDPTQARSDMLAEDELETAASLARIARVSRRFCRLIDSFGWVVIDGEGYSRDLRKRLAKRLVAQVYNDVQLQATSLSGTWLKDGVVAATVVLQYPFQQGFPIKIHPFPVPELYGFALRELNLLGGATSCIEGSWLEP